jgi:CBS domain-containing protein
MAFLSEFIGRPVVDLDGQRIGAVKDLIARNWVKFPHPVIEAMLIQSKGGETLIPFTEVAVFIAPVIALKVRSDQVKLHSLEELDIFLVRDVLDKQIIDTDGARVVRVNDLELVRVNGTFLVSNVDIGGMGILRRIGMAKFAENLAHAIHAKVPKNFVSWDNMEILRYDQSMRLKVPVEKLSEFHPADIAEIVSDLNRLQSSHFLESLDVERLADTLEEVEPDFQARLLEGMADERVADVLEEMEPDEATDLLAELPKERSEGLLALMEADDAEDIRKLLAYPEDSAGGIMTTEYITVQPEVTAEEAIQIIRKNGPEAETIFYIYVTDERNHLVGVLSLSSLIFAQPEARISDFMVKRVITVHLLDEQEDVAQLMSKYDLLAIPVVDDEEILHGIVTADDALDKIIPTAWKKRLPRFYR